MRVTDRNRPENGSRCEFSLRLATPRDVPELAELIPRSVRALSEGIYSPQQIEAAIERIFGVDSQLIEDGTYFVAEAGGRIVGAGGWSRRRTLYGGDRHKGGAPDDLLDPASDAARIRAFYVDPAWARRGIGRAILSLCERAALGAGFSRLELLATLPGVPLYSALGYAEIRPVAEPLGGGLTLPAIVMAKAL
jgi:GNAT superfamily N-acetyltransferase